MWNLGEEKEQKGEQLREPGLQWDQSHSVQQCPVPGGSGGSWGWCPPSAPLRGMVEGLEEENEDSREGKEEERSLGISKCPRALESSVTPRQWVLGVWVGEAPPCPLPLLLVPFQDSLSASQLPLPREGLY